MAKISKKSIRLQDGDIDERLEFQVMYNTELTFYAEIPEHLVEKFDQMEAEELKTYNAGRKYQRKYYSSSQDPHQRIVKGTTEDQVVTNMKKLVLHLLKLSMEKIPVIVIEFENKNNDTEDDQVLAKTGMTLEVTYCFKISTAGGTDKYYQYFTGQRRREVHLNDWAARFTVIPDTPENRQFLEDLHKALHTLTKKMEQFTETPENMLGFISSKQKLISQ